MARAVLINITGGPDTSIIDINEAAQMITQAADPEANIIFGAGIDENLEDEVHITVIATGFEKTQEAPVTPGLKTPVTTTPASAPAAPAEDKPAHAEPPQPLEMEEPKAEENDPFEDIFKIFQNRD